MKLSNVLYSLGALAIVGLFVFSISAHYTTQEWVAIEVLSTDRECHTVSTDEGSRIECQYMVFTDVEVFRNVDSLLSFKWNSADVQRQLRPGERYEVRVTGWRIPFLSSFRNILEVREYDERSVSETTVSSY